MKPIKKPLAFIALVLSFSAIALEQGSGLLLHGLDIRVGHESMPVLIKTNECFYEAEASSETLGKITLTPIAKVCDYVRTEMKAESIIISAKKLTNTFTGERINTATVATEINVATWE